MITTPHSPAGQAQPVDDLANVEQLMLHFETLEQQFQQVREGLTHSHRLATLGTVAAVIAHEYNNILTPIISYAQLALANPQDTALMKKALEKTLAGADRAAHISASLLGFARDADERHAARLTGVVNEAIGCLAREPRRDGISLVVDVPDVQVAMSPLNLQQVLVNLLLNARQAMKKTGGTLRVTASCENQLVRITVSDTGPGIPETIADRLFEPFVTLRRDEPGPGASPRGTGLGLCICRDLVNAAGGTITAESQPGQGAAFHITLPCADDLFETT